MLPGSMTCELRMMLLDSTMGSDGFHDVVIENLAATPAWQSSHVSPSDMTALCRRWPRAVFRTMSHHGLHMERLRRGARHRPDRAFRHNAPGFALSVRTGSSQRWTCTRPIYIWKWLSCSVVQSNGARCGKVLSDPVRNI